MEIETEIENENNENQIKSKDAQYQMLDKNVNVNKSKVWNSERCDNQRLLEFWVKNPLFTFGKNVNFLN